MIFLYVKLSLIMPLYEVEFSCATLNWEEMYLLILVHSEFP